jgi:hypothetical protein
MRPVAFPHRDYPLVLAFEASGDLSCKALTKSLVRMRVRSDKMVRLAAFSAARATSA